MLYNGHAFSRLIAQFPVQYHIRQRHLKRSSHLKEILFLVKRLVSTASDQLTYIFIQQISRESREKCELFE